MKLNDYFFSCDIFLCATLATLGYKVDGIDKSNTQKVEFCFHRDSKLDEIIGSYWRGELRVEPQLFSSNLKQLKNRIYSN